MKKYSKKHLAGMCPAWVAGVEEFLDMVDAKMVALSVSCPASSAFCIKDAAILLYPNSRCSYCSDQMGYAKKGSCPCAFFDDAYTEARNLIAQWKKWAQVVEGE